jgi:hypothetical protein
MALTIEHSVQIAAPPEAIWRLLIDPNSWRFWWPNVRAVEVEDRKPLREGSTLELALQLGFFPMTLRPHIEIAQEPKTLHWTTQRLGVSGRHAFYLEPRPRGTAVLRRERLTGPGLPLFRLLRLDHSTAVMFRDSLRGLKRLVERSV